MSNNKRFASLLILTGLVLTTGFFAAPKAQAGSNLPVEGMLVVDSGGTVYLIENGQRRPFSSADVFFSHGYNFFQLNDATAEDLALPQGPRMVYADGTLVLARDGTVYVIANGQKRGFTSAEVFFGLGYSFANLVDDLGADILAYHPEGIIIDSAEIAHPAGTLILSGRTVYQVMTSGGNSGSNGKKGIPTLEIFQSHGFLFQRVVKANSYDLALPDLGNLSARVVPMRTLVSNPRAPSAPQINGATNVVVNTVYTYSAVSTDPDGDYINYTFNWGDGTVSNRSALSGNEVFVLNQEWAAAGVYTVTVRAADEYGNYSESSITVNVTSGIVIPPPLPGISNLILSVDATNPPNALLVGGSSKVTVAELNFAAGTEDLSLTNLHFDIRSINGGSLYSEINQVYLFDGATQIASRVPTTTSSVTFQNLNGFVIPRMSSKRLTVKVDVGNVTNGQGDGYVARSGKGVSFNVYEDSYGAVGLASAEIVSNSNKTGTFGGSEFTVYKSIPTFQRVNLPSTLSNGVQSLYRFSLTADPKGDIGFYKAAFEVSQGGAVVGSYKLYDEYGTVNQVDLTADGARQASSGNQLNVTFTTIPSRPAGDEYRLIAAGQSKTYTLQATVSNASGATVSTLMLGDSAFSSSNPSSAVGINQSPYNNFIWSDLHRTTNPSTWWSADQWNNGFRVPGLAARTSAQVLVSSSAPPTSDIGLVNPGAITVTAPAGQYTNAFTLRSTTARSFLFYGSPTSYGPGINIAESSGGITPGGQTDIRIQVNSNVPAGTYTGTARLRTSDPGVTGEITFPITVVVTVPLPNQGTLSFSKNSFDFTYSPGGVTPADQEIIFTNTSNVTITYTLSNNRPSWSNRTYVASPLTSAPGQNTSLLASVNPAGLSAGTYRSDITMSGNFAGSPKVIPINLTVAGLPDFSVELPMDISPKLTTATNGIEIYKDAVVSFSVKNNGSTALKPTMSITYTGASPAGSTQYISENTCNVLSQLASNQSCVYAVRLSYNQATSLTNNDIRLDIDPSNSIAESDESNNWGITSFGVRSVPVVPVLISLSQTSGPPGTKINIQGTDIMLLGQPTTVLFGATQASFPFGSGFTLFDVTVPTSLTPGVYPVTVQNGLSTTNALSFTVTGPVYPSYRHIKVQSSSNSWVAWHDIEAYDNAGNLLTPVSCDASGNYLSSCTAVYPGSPSYWNAGGFSGWISLDYGSNKSIKEIRLKPSNSPNLATGTHEIFGMADVATGSGYVSLKTFTGQYYDQQWLSYQVPAVQGTVTANRAPSTPTISKTGQTVTGYSTDLDGDAITYRVNWGDGSAEETLRLGSGYAYSFIHAWKAGTYFVTITAGDERGGLSSAGTNVSVYE